MHIPAWAWAAAIAALAALFGADLVTAVRRRGPVRMREAALWTAVTVALSAGFGLLLAVAVSGTVAGQFYAGWLTEYSLSVDNLLVFAVLIAGSGIAERSRDLVLLLGIVLALVLRGLFIAAGAAALRRFDWVQYVFAGVLMVAAVTAVRSRHTPGLPADAAGRARAPVPVRWFTRGTGATGGTTLLALAVAIAVADVAFAVDSIPAIFGLTRDPLVVFAANLFALAGLRHLYFLVSGLLSKVVHLSVGLAAILAFISLKIFADGLRDSGLNHLGPLPVPHVDALVSLGVIAGLIALTLLASFLTRRRERQAGEAPRHQA
jgi:TerC family integral membrane protein